MFYFAHDAATSHRPHLDDTKGTFIVIAQDQVVATPEISNSLFHRSWPLAGLVTAMLVSLAWMGFLGYGLFRLFGPAFL